MRISQKYIHQKDTVKKSHEHSENYVVRSVAYVIGCHTRIAHTRIRGSFLLKILRTN